jgi:Cell morphogenesis N-terminal
MRIWKHSISSYYLSPGYSILPVCSNRKIATAEVNTPSWANTIQSLYPVIHKMMQKQRHWHVACPLAVTLLCVSPREYFASKWWDICEPILLKLRDKTFKNLALACIARLIWCYVFRAPEAPAAMQRKFDTVIRSVFPSGKKAVVPSDTPLEIFVQLIRFIGAKHHDYVYKSILHHLMNGDILAKSQGLISVELLQPERMTIAVRGYLAILSDIENKVATPPFPGVAFEYEDEVPIDKRATAILSASALTTARIEEHYNSFSRLLGLIAYSTDMNFGGAALVEDKPYVAPKTPISATFSFSNSESPSTPLVANIRDRHLFFDLLHAVFDAFPTCIPRNLATSKLIEMLCHGTAHTHYGVAQSASNALKVIARRPAYSQLVVTGFARFMFKLDEKMARNPTPAGGIGILTSPNAENTLALYVELLKSWLECIRAKKQDLGNDQANVPATPDPDPNFNPTRGEEMEMTTVWTVIEETEAHGLFFLCHQHQKVRHFALKILRLIREFDTALLDESGDGKDIQNVRSHNRNPSRIVRGPRVIDVFDANEVLEGFLHDTDLLPVAERSRLQVLHQRRKEGNVLVRLAEGTNSFDVSLWYKAFPKFIKACFDQFPMTVVLTRNMICDRLVQMHGAIVNLVETTRTPTAGPFDMAPKISPRTQAAEGLVEQWKLYLIVACSTLTLTDEQPARTQVQHHGRKKSIPAQPFQRLTSARSVFRLIIPFLGAEHTTVREAVVVALGCINVNLYRALLDDLYPTIKMLNDEAAKNATRAGPAKYRPRSNRQRQEITHVLNLTAHFLQQDSILKDEWILGQLVDYVRGLKLFLTNEDNQVQWEFQEMRRHFCGLVEAVSEGTGKFEDPQSWLPLEGRTSLFRLIEEWCGHGPRSYVKDREKRMRMSIMDEYKDVRDRGALTAAMEIEKKKLEMAALSCMAALCVCVFEEKANRSTDHTFRRLMMRVIKRPSCPLTLSECCSGSMQCLIPRAIGFTGSDDGHCETCSMTTLIKSSLWTKRWPCAMSTRRSSSRRRVTSTSLRISSSKTRKRVTSCTKFSPSVSTSSAILVWKYGRKHTNS